MATWLVHLRVADYFLDRFDKKSGDEFLIGSVAPDCGYGQKDSFSGFVPPTTVTHWTASGRKAEIDLDSFFNTYLKGFDVWGKASFYLGYFMHLLTDVKWSSEMYLPTRIKYHDEYEKNPEFLIEIKKDWNDLDHRFLHENPDFRAFDRFCAIRQIKDYMPYYEPGQIKRQCAVIADYYKSFDDVERVYREYQYLTPERQNEFVGLICQSVMRFLSAVDIIHS